MPLAPRGLIVAEANNASALRKARNMFSEEAIKNRINTCEHTLSLYQMDVAEAKAVGKSSEYCEKRVKELEDAVVFWKQSLYDLRDAESAIRIANYASA